MNLIETLQQLKENNSIKDYYFHRNFDTGEIELNIEFQNNNKKFNEIINNSNIKEIESSAFWE